LNSINNNKTIFYKYHKEKTGILVEPRNAGLNEEHACKALLRTQEGEVKSTGINKN